MSKCLYKKRNYSFSFILLSGFLFLVAFIVPAPAYSLDLPHIYYDWNTYSEPPQQVLGVQALAQEKTKGVAQTASYKNYKQFTYPLGFTANLAPTNPFYGLKRAQENLALTFTFDPKQKEQQRIAIAGERLSEMEQMANQGKAKEVSSLAVDYNSTAQTVASNLKALKAQGQNVLGLLAATDLEVAKHVLVLEEVSLKAPPQATLGIQTAVAASEHAIDTVADLAGRPAMPPEVANRIAALRAQGLLTKEEATKLTSVNSRVQAREELRKLTVGRILPAADFKKLDEAARAYFPQGYANIIEIRKFKELKDLETQKPDESTIKTIQDFASKYRPGEAVPTELRRWWVPLIRLEELQNTIRPDLIQEDFFQYRPEDRQKYREFVERVKPRTEDVDYVTKLAEKNPSILSDPAYARIKAIADKFGAISPDASALLPAAQSCSRDSHWVFVPFMPNGGYCVPNIVYAVEAVSNITGRGVVPAPCPPGYHRNDPQGPCFPDNLYGPGGGLVRPPVGGTLQGFCSSGYHWVPLPQSGGYCAPDTPTIGGGQYPGPISPPSYCPAGQMFRDGKCETYNVPPKDGCPQGQWWNGQKCITQKDCGPGKYQDYTGECRSVSDIGDRICSAPPAGCGFNAYWDTVTCSCKSTDYPRPTGGFECKAPSSGCPSGWYWNASACSCNLNPGTTPPPECKAPSSGCPSGWTWVASACSCNYTGAGGDTYQTPSGTCTKSPSECSLGTYLDYASCSCKTSTTYQSPSYGTPSGGGTYSCGAGYYWNGSYCAPSGGTTGTYGTPTYTSPTGTYPTPSYGTPTGTYATPTYPTPSGTYGTPTYGTPSYGTPSYGTPSYGTPSYGTPSYGTPSYGTPESYGTPSYGTPAP